ncbi:MAG: hypothetical protein ACLTEE_06180 [Anaerobutyricum hallii]
MDEVFINIPESEPYPAELDKFIVRWALLATYEVCQVPELTRQKQFVEHLGTYTVLTTSINSEAAARSS